MKAELLQLLSKLKFHNRKLQVGGLTLLGLLIFIIFMDQLVMPWWSRKGWDTTVPNLVGLDIKQAQEELANGSLKVEIMAQKYEPHQPAGTIIFQTPPADATVKQDRTIKVMVSLGGETVTVPNLAGVPVEKARLLLSGRNLQSGEVDYVLNDTLPAERVVSTFPLAGSKVPAGMIINLIVSQGQLHQTASVPDLLGKNLEEGKKLIEKNGVRLGRIRYQIDDELLPMTILAQSIEPGQEVEMGTKLDLIVSILEK